MSKGGIDVFVLGAFPPPVDGKAVITHEFANRCSEVASVRICRLESGARSVAPLYHMRRLYRALRASFLVLVRAKRRDVVYVAVDSGWGMLYTLLFAIAASIKTCRLFLHHHSFAYLNEKWLLARLVWGVNKERTTHIVLCARMERLGREKYGGDGCYEILNNCAFSNTLPNDLGAKEPTFGDLFVVGLISNLSREKGLFLFLEVVKKCNELGAKIFGILAGPIAKRDHLEFKRMTKGRRDIEYVGPVYGSTKEEFFRSIDLLMFPTLYELEAQPMVLVEAVSAGLPFIALERGCIGCDWGAVGVVVASTDRALEELVGKVMLLSSDRTYVRNMRARSIQTLSDMRKEGSSQLSRVLDKIVGH